MALEKYVAYRGPDNRIFYAEKITSREIAGRREVGYLGYLTGPFSRGVGGGVPKVFKSCKELQGPDSIWKFDGGRVFEG